MKEAIGDMREVKKFLQTLEFSTWMELVREAKKRGCSVQDLLRVELVPYWLNSNRRKEFHNPKNS